MSVIVNLAGQPPFGVRPRDAGEPFLVESPPQSDTPIFCALDSLIAEIREHHRWRVFFHRAEKSLVLQAKAQCRRVLNRSDMSEKARASCKKEAEVLYKAINGKGDHPLAITMQVFLAPTLEARDINHKARMHYEKAMTACAKQLPVWPWVEGICGFGALGLAQIVGEAGDLGSYANPAKLWKRFGLAVIEGRAQRRVSGEEALKHGFSPERRAAMFCIGDSLIKKQNEYRALYLGRKEYEMSKLPESEGGRKIVWHRRAQRYTEKRLLRELWKAWRRV